MIDIFLTVCLMSYLYTLTDLQSQCEHKINYPDELARTA